MQSKWRKYLCLMLVFVLVTVSFPSAASGNPEIMRSPEAAGGIMAFVTPPAAISTPTIAISAPLVAAVTPAPGADDLAFDGTQSGWAEPEIQAAYDNGLTYPQILGSYGNMITREEFCTIVVKLYEKLTGAIANAGSDPFKDTDNAEILKAYNLKIVKGTSSNTFMPAEKVTRQEICLMIFRALDVSLPSLVKDISGPFPFADSGQIASWAIDAMKFAYKNMIMKGTPDNKIAPLSNTTREQAIALLNRTYVKYRTSVTPEVQPPDLPTVRLTVPPSTRQDTRKNFAWMVSGNAFIPKYDQRLELFVSTLPGKPSLKPVSPGLASAGTPKPMNGDMPLLAYNGNMSTDDLLGAISNPGTTVIRPTPTAAPPPPVVPAPSGPYYTSAGAGAFIDQTGDRVRWFSFKLKNAPGAANVAWQVSTLPFNGATLNWKNPAGFVKSGQVAASAGEFTIDFGNLGSRFVSILTPGTGAYKPIAQGQKYYYVRAFPLDSAGNPIGEPGDGTPVIYGKPAVNKQSTPAPDKTCELWTPLRTHFGDYGAENNDKPAKYAEIGMSPDDTAQGKMFCFQNMDHAVSKVLIQVSDSAFPANDSWPTNAKLLYEKSYNAPVTDSAVPANVSRTTYPASVVVPFADFAMKSSDMAVDSHKYYYVRGVMVKPALTPGTVDASFTNTIRVDYYKAQPLQLYMPPAPKYEYVNRSMPNIRMKSYTPVKWASQDYLQHYYIYRKPVADDIKFYWANTQTGEVLYPYDDFFGKQYYHAQGINSVQAYEDIVIPRVLPLNSKVYFAPPTSQDEAWYDELYAMVSEFINDLVFVASEIVNQVSSAYNNLKSGLINYVVNLCPFDSLKGAFKTALEAMVNYGLVAVGLPPTLPNFDELSSMSLNYLAEVALTEAGIPATDLTLELTKKVAAGIGNEIVAAANHADSKTVGLGFEPLLSCQGSNPLPERDSGFSYFIVKHCFLGKLSTDCQQTCKPSQHKGFSVLTR